MSHMDLEAIAYILPCLMSYYSLLILFFKIALFLYRRRMEGTMLKQSNRTEPVTAWQPDRLAFSTPRTAQRSHMTPNYLPRFDTFSKLDQLRLVLLARLCFHESIF